MTIRERLKDCKIKEGIQSDYGLAKRLGINPARICDYMAGRSTPDAYTAVKMAEILKVHPLLLLAEFEAETEKDETKRAFWINFVQRIRTGAVQMWGLIFTASWLIESNASGTLDLIRIMYIMSN